MRGKEEKEGQKVRLHNSECQGRVDNYLYLKRGVRCDSDFVVTAVERKGTKRKKRLQKLREGRKKGRKGTELGQTPTFECVPFNLRVGSQGEGTTSPRTTKGKKKK